MSTTKEGMEALQKEEKFHGQLGDFRGKEVPQYYGLYEACLRTDTEPESGADTHIRCMFLEYCGTPTTDLVREPRTFRQAMYDAYHRLHSKAICKGPSILGDVLVQPHNILKRSDESLCIIDFSCSVMHYECTKSIFPCDEVVYVRKSLFPPRHFLVTNGCHTSIIRWYHEGCTAEGYLEAADEELEDWLEEACEESNKTPLQILEESIKVVEDKRKQWAE